MKFKTELILLLASIVLFVISAFCFSYALSLTYPLRTYAFPFVGFGGALMTIASVSYSKRSKTCP